MPGNFNVCFITEDFYPGFIGGQGIFGCHLVSQLAKQSIKVTVLAEKKEGRREFWQNKKNIRLHLVPFCLGQQLVLALLQYIYFILRLRNKHFDILHANQLSGFFFVLFRPKNIGRIVISVHNTNYDLCQAADSIFKKLLYQSLIILERWMYRRADALLFHTDSELRALRRYYSIGKKPSGVVYLGSHPVKISRTDIHSSKKLKDGLKIAKDEKIVLSVARLVRRKKIATLIQALNILKTSDEKVTAIIIGQGSARGGLVKAVSKLRLHISFVGFVPDTKIAPYFLIADLFVLTSTAEGGVSLAAIEAAGFGLPLIVSPDAAGFPLVRENINGYIVDPDNPQDLAEKIKLAINNAQKMGEESKKIARKFTWERCARETAKFYHEVINI